MWPGETVLTPRSQNWGLAENIPGLSHAELRLASTLALCARSSDLKILNAYAPQATKQELMTVKQAITDKNSEMVENISVPILHFEMEKLRPKGEVTSSLGLFRGLSIG